MKKYLFMIFVAAMLLSGTAFSEMPNTGQCGDNVSWILFENGTLTISGIGQTWDYLSSGENRIRPWEPIYSNSTNLQTDHPVKNVIFNEGITTVGKDMFSYNETIETVSLPESLIFIGENAFKNTSIKNIVIPANVETIAPYAFADSKICSVFIPQEVESIGSGAFGSRSLKEISVDKNNRHYTAVDGVLFTKDMKTLVCYPAGKNERKYVVPDTVETIEEYAFYSCDLVEIVLPDELKTINSGAFTYCYYLTEINIPENVETIGSGAFSLCHCLKKLTIPRKCEIGTSILSGSNEFNAMVFLGDTPPSVQSTGNENKIFHEIYHPDNIEWDEWLDANTFAWDREKYGVIDRSSSWAADEVEKARLLGLITERTSCGWQSSITRSAFAELIVNEVEKAVGKELSPADDSCFDDTYNIAALKAYNAGIINGTGEAAFSPGDYATREQIATMLCRAAEYIERETNKRFLPTSAEIPDEYTDKSDVSAWAASAVARLNAAGIMKGTSGTELSPQATVTVQESILLVKRMYEAVS